MKKKLILSIILAAITAVMLVACGSDSPSPSSQPKGSGTEMPSANPSGGGLYDVGAFQVALPAGWTAFPQRDMFEEKDENGEYPVDPKQIFMADGASDEIAAMDKPSVRIYYHEPNTTVIDSRDFYDDVEDIEVEIKGTPCKAYRGDSFGYTYEIVTYETEDGIYEFDILTQVEGKDTGINAKSPEITSIMESVQTKK